MRYLRWLVRENEYGYRTPPKLQIYNDLLSQWVTIRTEIIKQKEEEKEEAEND